MNGKNDRKALAASLLGCQPEELLGFRDEGLAGVVLIAPDGRKHRFPEELLRRAQAWLVEEQPPLPCREGGRVVRSTVAGPSKKKPPRPKGPHP